MRSALVTFSCRLDVAGPTYPALRVLQVCENPGLAILQCQPLDFSLVFPFSWAVFLTAVHIWQGLMLWPCQTHGKLPETVGHISVFFPDPIPHDTGRHCHVPVQVNEGSVSPCVVCRACRVDNSFLMTTQVVW